MVNTQEIKAELVRKKHTQRTLAVKMGMDKNTLNAKINGKRPMTDGDIVKLCKELEVKEDRKVIELFLPELLAE